MKGTTCTLASIHISRIVHSYNETKNISTETLPVPLPVEEVPPPVPIRDMCPASQNLLQSQPRRPEVVLTSTHPFPSASSYSQTSPSLLDSSPSPASP